jgi:MFS superfamily sulfate permease-like transporter
VVAIVFVSGVESLLCSRMADRLADNRGVPYNPNKELWGQGWVQILVPLFNGFPHTGALARTATNIKVGAVSPLAGVFKFALKLLLTAVMGPMTDFLIGVLSALVIYGLLYRFLDDAAPHLAPQTADAPLPPAPAHGMLYQRLNAESDVALSASDSPAERATA